MTETFTPYNSKTILRAPQWGRIPEELREAVMVVSQILPFRTNRYVLDELIDWDNVPDDPIFRLNFPHRAMLDEGDKELASTEHTEYGTLTLAMPNGVNEILPGMSLTIQVVPPGDRTTPHSHSWWHLYVVRSGAGSVIFDELPDAAGLEAADLVLIPAWSVHHFENREAADDLVLLSMTNLPQQAILSNLLSREFSDEAR